MSEDAGMSEDNEDLKIHFDFDPEASQLVPDRDPQEVAGAMSAAPLPEDMRLGEVSFGEDGLSLPVDVTARSTPRRRWRPRQWSCENSPRLKPNSISAGLRPRSIPRLSALSCCSTSRLSRARDPGDSGGGY